MILESIQLRHVGLFTESVTAGPFSERLNILAAANESGKTTLIKAATRALFDRHTCKDQEIKALQPAGCDLAPKIAVVFQVASGKFKIEKTFLLSPKCQLSEWKADSWQLIAEGDEADKRLMTLLQSTQPGRGASNEAHWGMMRYLWARQGEPAAWPKWDGASGQSIQNRLARVELDPLIDRLRADLWADYLENYTATGQAKANGPLKKADEQLEQIDIEIREIQSKRRELENLQIDFQTLSSQLSFLQVESVQKQKEAVEIRELAAQVELLGVELKSKQETLENAKAFLGTIERDAQCADKLKTELGATKELLATTEIQAEGYKKSEADQTEKQTQSGIALEEHQTKLANFRGELEHVQKLVKLRNAQKDSDQLESLSKKVSRHRNRQKELQEKRDGLPDITPAKLNKLEAAQLAVREKKAQLQALGLTLELTPDKDANIQILEPGKKRAEVLNAKTPKAFNSVEQSLELKLEGWGKVSIRSGSKELKDLAEQLNDAENDLTESLLKTGVESVDAARTALVSRKEFEQQMQATTTAIDDLLADWESVEEFERELNTSRNRLAVLESSLALSGSEKKQSLADIEALEQKLQVQVEQHDRAVKDSAKSSKAIRTELDSVREKRQEGEKQVATLKSKIQGIEQQIQNVAARYPEGIQKAREIAQQTFVEAQAHLEVTKKKLPAEHEKLPQRNKRAAKAAEEVTTELQNKGVQYNQMQGHLTALGSEGLYSKETDLLERRETVSRIAEGVRARGWATRLVHDLIENRKQAATRSVLAPLEARLSSVFAEITGDHHRQVFLDGSLQIRGTGRNENELIEFGSLSQGAREQLLIALRLAVATELATGEPQLLILDDVLVNTDPTRQNRVLDLLRSAEPNLQILILTCHPERYRGIGSVVTITKEAVNS